MGKFTVYLAGKITDNENYKRDFIKAEWRVKELLGDNILILSPAVLPENIDYNKAINITSAMLREADMVVLLKNWKNSRGATQEDNRMNRLGGRSEQRKSNDSGTDNRTVLIDDNFYQYRARSERC